MTLVEDDVRRRVITTVEIPAAIEVVDLCQRRALAAGATGRR